MTDLDTLQRDLETLVSRYRRDGLVDATIYNRAALAWPAVPKHDFFAFVQRSQKKVSLYLKQLEDDPSVLDEWPALKRLHTGKVTLGFTSLDEDLRAALVALLDRLHAAYVAAHSR